MVKNIISSIILAAIPAAISFILMQSWIPAIIVMVFLIMLGLQAAEDRKCQMVYVFPTIICFVAGIIALFFYPVKYGFVFTSDKLYMLITVLAIIIFSISGSMGTGDILIYATLVLFYYLIVPKIAGIVSLLTMMLSLLIFIIRHLPEVKKQKTLRIVSGYTTDIYTACLAITTLATMFAGIE